jgi:hypothetical protein
MQKCLQAIDGVLPSAIAITQCSPLSLQRGAILRRPSRPSPTTLPEGLQIKCDGRVGCHTGLYLAEQPPAAQGVPPATRRAAASTADGVSDGKREAQSTAADTVTLPPLPAQLQRQQVE